MFLFDELFYFYDFIKLCIPHISVNIKNKLCSNLLNRFAFAHHYYKYELRRADNLRFCFAKCWHCKALIV